MRTSCQSQSATRAKNAALMEHEDFDPSDANDNKHADYYPGMLYFRHHLSDGSQHNCWSRDGRQWLEQDDNVLEFMSFHNPDMLPTKDESDSLE